MSAFESNTVRDHVAVTLDRDYSDPNYGGKPFDAVYVSVAGNVTITSTKGNDLTYPSIPVGWFPVGGKKVKTSDTTATIFAVGWTT